MTEPPRVGQIETPRQAREYLTQVYSYLYQTMHEVEARLTALDANWRKQPEVNAEVETLESSVQGVSARLEQETESRLAYQRSVIGDSMESVIWDARQSVQSIYTLADLVEELWRRSEA